MARAPVATAGRMVDEVVARARGARAADQAGEGV
jgi:hypothetical protein